MRKTIFFCFSIFLIFSCGSTQKSVEKIDIIEKLEEVPVETIEEPKFKKPVDYNFKILASDIGINDPSNDRLSYYRVFVDKIEAGRTTTGIESQQKVFESMIENTRHLVTLEKYILDEHKGKYIKLNRIDQPRPNYYYFEIPAGRIVVLSLERNAKSGEAVFTLNYEME